jgi:hypothetical protein
MSTNLSVSLYRVLMRAYPAEFQQRYGDSVDQAFRDMSRDAFQKRGYVGIALLWFHVVPDFLFSAGELLTRKAGDFLKWRFRLQWVLACTLGFVLWRFIGTIVGPESIQSLERVGHPWIYLGSLVHITILMSSMGLMQSRVLAGRCFRKKQWVLYGFAGAIVGALIVLPLWRVAGRPVERAIFALIEMLGDGDLLRRLSASLAASGQMLFFGAITGFLQASAIRNDAITRRRWMIACALGYYFAWLAGWFVGEHLATQIRTTIPSQVVSGAVLGLITSGPLERILFDVQADSREKS